jgi:hypothetical protein
MEFEFEAMETLSSKLEDFADELETEAGSGPSLTLGSSEGSSQDDSASEHADDLDDELDFAPPETDLLLRERPFGCPVDPCRIYAFMSIAERRKAFPQFSTMPTIPEEEPTFMPPEPARTWKRIFMCFGAFDSSDEEEETTPVVEATGLGMRRAATTVNLAALVTSA